MELQIQDLVSSIKKDGIDSANQQAAAILADARKQADAIVAEAKSQADKLRDDAKAEIDVGAQPTITVPTASILYRENRSGVFVLMTNNHVRFQQVNVLSRAADRTSVTGLTAGVQVIVDGAGFLGDGDRVNVVAARAPAAAATTPAAPAAR